MLLCTSTRPTKITCRGIETARSLLRRAASPRRNNTSRGPDHDHSSCQLSGRKAPNGVHVSLSGEMHASSNKKVSRYTCADLVPLGIKWSYRCCIRLSPVSHRRDEKCVKFGKIRKLKRACIHCRARNAKESGNSTTSRLMKEGKEVSWIPQASITVMEAGIQHPRGSDWRKQW